LAADGEGPASEKDFAYLKDFVNPISVVGGQGGEAQARAALRLPPLYWIANISV
jgi:hypothetical protein